MFGKHLYTQKKPVKQKLRKSGEVNKAVKELRQIISVLNSLINSLNENISQAQRIGSVITASNVGPISRTSIRVSSAEPDLSLPELQVAEGVPPEKKEEKKVEKSLEETLDDILVVAVAEDLLKS